MRAVSLPRRLASTLASVVELESPSTKPGFIRAEDIDRLTAALKILTPFSAPSSSVVTGKKHNWAAMPSKTEISTIRLFPKDEHSSLLLRSLLRINEDTGNSLLLANVKKKRKARMNKHKRKKRRRALRYKAPQNK